MWHVASPAPKSRPRHEDDLIRPAVDGTRRVLRAAEAAGVGRVILTSSIDAVRSGHPASDGIVHSERDWSILARSDSYAKSKTLAEQAAWNLAERSELSLVTVNPGLVLGPVLRREANVSVEVIRLLLARGLPAVPRLGFAVTDVRDVATAHRQAMETPEAAGHRFIVAGGHRWMPEIAAVLATEYRPRGYPVPTRPLPYPLMWLGARFDKTTRLALPFVDVPALVTSEKAAAILGWRSRSVDDTILATAESLLDHGVVLHSSGDRSAGRSAVTGGS